MESSKYVKCQFSSFPGCLPVHSHGEGGTGESRHHSRHSGEGRNPERCLGVISKYCNLILAMWNYVNLFTVRVQFSQKAKRLRKQAIDLINHRDRAGRRKEYLFCRRYYLSEFPSQEF